MCHLACYCMVFFQLLRLPAGKCFWKLMKNNSISVTICQLYENNCLFCCPVEFETNEVRTQFSLWCLRKIYSLTSQRCLNFWAELHPGRLHSWQFTSIRFSTTGYSLTTLMKKIKLTFAKQVILITIYFSSNSNL